MTDTDSPDPVIRSYFVDEAGDPTLFSAKGKIIVGEEGCSKFFILGKIDVADPSALAADLESLRAGLLADPYFRGIPSMQPEQRKTAIAFHAKDDLPEVRREVFSVLLKHELRFYAVVREKQAIAQKVLDHNKKRPTYRYHSNQLYDKCVSQLFKERLHKDAGYSITFARRGNSDRTEALDKALQAARNEFTRKWGIVGSAPIGIVPSSPKETACLQAVDYYLWALQRFYERSEDRFLSLVWPQTKVVLDVDDTRDKGYGVYYTQSHALTLSAAMRAKK